MRMALGEAGRRLAAQTSPSPKRGLEPRVEDFAPTSAYLARTQSDTPYTGAAVYQLTGKFIRAEIAFQGFATCQGFRTVHLCAELLLPSDLSPVGVLTEVRNRRLPKVYTPTQTTETAHTHTCAKWPSMAALN